MLSLFFYVVVFVMLLRERWQCTCELCHQKKWTGFYYFVHVVWYSHRKYVLYNIDTYIFLYVVQSAAYIIELLVPISIYVFVLSLVAVQCILSHNSKHSALRFLVLSLFNIVFMITTKLLAKDSNSFSSTKSFCPVYNLIHTLSLYHPNYLSIIIAIPLPTYVTIHV